jgi:hypothetical protein
MVSGIGLTGRLEGVSSKGGGRERIRPFAEMHLKYIGILSLRLNIHKIFQGVYQLGVSSVRRVPYKRYTPCMYINNGNIFPYTVVVTRVTWGIMLVPLFYSLKELAARERVLKLSLREVL